MFVCLCESLPDSDKSLPDDSWWRRACMSPMCGAWPLNETNRPNGDGSVTIVRRQRFRGGQTSNLGAKSHDKMDWFLSLSAAGFACLRERKKEKGIYLERVVFLGAYVYFLKDGTAEDPFRQQTIRQARQKKDRKHNYPLRDVFLILSM